MSGRIVRPEQTVILNLPEVGRLKIGMKNEKGYPQSLDYFRPTGKYAELFTQACGPKPSTLQIVFPSDNAEAVCNERYEYRDDKGALVSRGDGRTFEIWNGKQYAPYSIEQYPNIMEQIAQKYPTKKGMESWQVALTLMFIVPAVRGVVGVWRFDTKGGASSVKNIRNSFDSVLAIRGTVTQTAFDLSVEFAKSNKPGVNSRYPVVSLVANDTRIAEIREAMMPKETFLLKSAKQ